MRRMKSAFLEAFLRGQEEALEKITYVFDTYRINFCFIGGAVLPVYNYRRFTEDIDVLVDQEDVDKIKNIPIGLMKDITYSTGRVRRLQLHQPKALVEVIYSGEDLSGAGFEFPNPSQVSGPNRILNLSSLLEFKLYAGVYGRGRIKDLGDVQELIKLNQLPIDFMNHLQDERLVDQFKSLWKDV